MNIKLKVGGVELIEFHREPMSEDRRIDLIGALAILILCGMFVFGICMMGR